MLSLSLSFTQAWTLTHSFSHRHSLSLSLNHVLEKALFALFLSFLFLPRESFFHFLYPLSLSPFLRISLAIKQRASSQGLSYFATFLPWLTGHKNTLRVMQKLVRGSSLRWSFFRLVAFQSTVTWSNLTLNFCSKPLVNLTNPWPMITLRLQPSEETLVF